MHTHKGQLSLFIIVAIVFLVVFFVVYYFGAVYAKVGFESQADKVMLDVAKTSSVDYYVTQCLDELATQAIVQIGQQGGYIFADQKGSLLNVTKKSLLYNDTRVAYQILKPQNQFWPLPYYPCYNASMTPDFCFFVQSPELELHLGDNDLPELGSRGIITERPSIEDQIVHYINTTLKECVDFAAISSTSGYAVDGKDTNVQVHMGETAVLIEASFPIHVSDERRVMARYLTFETSIPVRLKKIYRLIGTYDGIVAKDNRYLSFAMESADDPSLPLNLQLKPHENIHIQKIRSVDGFDDVVRITDYTSQVRGVPYTFQFAVENRYPALNYIPTTPSTNPQYDLVAPEGTELSITPLAYDPDEEDNISYSYAGWKEDYDETFRYADCLAHFSDCRAYPQKYVDELANQLHLWSSHTTINLTRQDLGVHQITVFATDPAGETDSQVIRILVDDKPNMLAFTSNNYPDVPARWASIEDPYTLNATATIDIFPGLPLRYFWRDVTTNTVLGNDVTVVLKEPGSYVSIVNIKAAITPFTTTGQHQVRLIVDSGPGTVPGVKEDADLLIDVKSCLPHRSNNPIAPFNSPGSDPFQANHACCKADGSYEFTNAICYVDVSYSCSGADIIATGGVHLCSGDRGNYCDGAVDTVRDFYCGSLSHHATAPFLFEQGKVYGDKSTGYRPTVPTGSSCIGKCFDQQNPVVLNQSNVCYSYEFSCSTQGPGNAICEPPKTQAGIYQKKDLDTDKSWCDDCASQHTEWTGTCCGDDDNEFAKQCQGVGCVDARRVCCGNSWDCVKNGNCYQNGEIIERGNNKAGYICEHGSWKYV